MEGRGHQGNDVVVPSYVTRVPATCSRVTASLVEGLRIVIGIYLAEAV
jgi:hypothetical protein